MSIVLRRSEECSPKYEVCRCVASFSSLAVMDAAVLFPAGMLGLGESDRCPSRVFIYATFCGSCHGAGWLVQERLMPASQSRPNIVSQVRKKRKDVNLLLLICVWLLFSARNLRWVRPVQPGRVQPRCLCGRRSSSRTYLLQKSTSWASCQWSSMSTKMWQNGRSILTTSNYCRISSCSTYRFLCPSHLPIYS